MIIILSLTVKTFRQTSGPDNFRYEPELPRGNIDKAVPRGVHIRMAGTVVRKQRGIFIFLSFLMCIFDSIEFSPGGLNKSN